MRRGSKVGRVLISSGSHVVMAIAQGAARIWRWARACGRTLSDPYHIVKYILYLTLVHI